MIIKDRTFLAKTAIETFYFFAKNETCYPEFDERSPLKVRKQQNQT